MSGRRKAVKQKKIPTDKKADIAKKYAALCQKFGRYMTINEFNDLASVTRDTLVYYHGSLGRLKHHARSAHPEKFKAILDENIFNTRAVKQLESLVKGCKRFVVTTAVTGCSVDQDFLESIKNYCSTNDAELLVLLATDPAATVTGSVKKQLKDVNKDGHIVDPVIPKESLVVSDVSFNSNIHIKTTKLSAKQIDPITGFSRLGQRDGSFVYASPKQRLKYTKNAKDKIPHAVMTTGAITTPNYTTRRYMSDRTATIATHDHVLGAVIIEIYDSKEYHFRQIQRGRDGSFVDLGRRYFPDKIEDDTPEAIVLGDWHSGDTDPVAKQVFTEVIKELQPPKIFLHDCFNGTSVNHHEDNDAIMKAKHAEEGKNSLQQELAGLASDINYLLDLTDQVVIVKSNHDEWLDNEYLRPSKFVKDPVNYRISLDLAAALYDGLDPLEYGVFKSGLKHPGRVLWLKRDQSYRVGGVELGAHGDGYVSGIRALENAYGDSVTGHTHAPQILRGAWVVGTLSKLKLSYNEGPSDWLHCSCLVYSDGSRQLINAINGRWRLPR